MKERIRLAIEKKLMEYPDNEHLKDVYKRQVLGGGDEIDAGGIVIDKAAHQVKIDGKEIELSFKEFELLSYFVENQGIALSREKILSLIHI